MTVTKVLNVFLESTKIVQPFSAIYVILEGVLSRKKVNTANRRPRRQVGIRMLGNSVAGLDKKGMREKHCFELDEVDWVRFPAEALTLLKGW